MTTDGRTIALTTEEYFDRLCDHRQPILAKTSGTLRFDVVEGESVLCWYVTIVKGDVSYTRGTEQKPADAVVHVEKKLFDDIVAGRGNAVAAVLRGEIGVEGKLDLVIVCQRLFPGPEEARES